MLGRNELRYTECNQLADVRSVCYLIRSLLTDFTVSTFEPVGAFTLVVIHQISTSTSILAGLRGTFVNICTEIFFYKNNFCFEILVVFLPAIWLHQVGLSLQTPLF